MKHAWYGDTETTAALRAFLASAAGWIYYPIELYDITLPSLGYATPLVLRWCDQVFDVTYPSPDTTATTLVTYAGGTHVASNGDADPGPVIERGRRKDVIGVEVDELDVTLYLDGLVSLPAADGGGATSRFEVGEALKAGIFNGATVVVRRAVLPAPPTWPVVASLANRGDLLAGDLSLGAVTLFGGLVSKYRRSGTTASLSVRSALEKMSTGMPRNVFQAGCLNDLYDGLCGISRTGSFGGSTFQQAAAITGTYTSSAAALLVTISYPTDTPVPHADDYFRFGSVQMTSGAMAGLSRPVRAQAAYAGDANVTQIDVLQPFPRIPEASDMVLLQAGCAKTRDDCETKFGNFVDGTTEVIDGTTYHINGLRFRGCPRVPPPDSAL